VPTPNIPTRYGKRANLLQYHINSQTLSRHCRLDNSEFLLSKLETAVTSARSLDLASFLTSVVLGLASVFLALATVLPASDLGYVRFLLFFSTGVVVVLLYWLIRRLARNRRTRLTLLRKWQKEAFLAREYVDSFTGEKVTRMVELIQSMEDISISSSPQYGQFDNEFKSMLK
jgi:hypothetical protein